MRAFQRALAVLAALVATATLPGATVAAGESLVMPYACSVRGDRVDVEPSPNKIYPILGPRERHPYTSCAPHNPDRCRSWMLHRFEILCGSKRVPWPEVYAAIAQRTSGHAWMEAGRLLVQPGPLWALSAHGQGMARRWRDRPRGRPDRFEREDPYGADLPPPRSAGPVIEMPIGFAPTLGSMARFMDGGPDVFPPDVAGDGFDRRQAQDPAGPDSEPWREAEAPVLTDPPTERPAPEARSDLMRSEPPAPEADDDAEPRAADSGKQAATGKPEREKSEKLAGGAAKDDARKAEAARIAEQPKAPGAETVTLPGGGVPLTILNRPGANADGDTAGRSGAEIARIATPALTKGVAEARLATTGNEILTGGITAVDLSEAPEQPAAGRTDPTIAGLIGGAVALALIGWILGWRILPRRVPAAASAARDIAQVVLPDSPAAPRSGRFGSKALPAPAKASVPKPPPPRPSFTAPANPPFGARQTGWPPVAESDSEVPTTRGEALSVLGLGPDANESVIKKIVDAMRQSWHPDLAKDEADRTTREKRLKQVNVAWDILCGKHSEA